MKNKMMRKILGVLLAVVMVVAGLPFSAISASAAVPTSYTDIGVDEAVSVSSVTSSNGKYFRFVPTRSGTYEIASYSISSGDPYVYLYDSAGYQLAYDDDSDSLNFKLSYRFESGKTYYINACAFSGYSRYSFKITAVELDEEELAEEARVEYNSSTGDLFLGGEYIELGISRHGSLGTSTGPTSSDFHNTENGISFIVDLDGWDEGEAPVTGDFFLPGTPEDRYVLAYNYNGTKYEYNVADRRGSISGVWRTTPTVRDASYGTTLRAIVEGVTTHGVKIEIVYSFGVNDKFFKTEFSVSNNSSYTITELRFVRDCDPDQDVNTFDMNETYNKVISNPTSAKAGGKDNCAVVVARGRDSALPFYYISFDNRARVSRNINVEGVSSAYDSALWSETHGYPNAPTSSSIEFPGIGYTLGDESVAITFALGTLSVGASTNGAYYSSPTESVSGFAVHTHTYDNDCDTNCNICDQIRIVPPHVYFNDCDTTCNVCGRVRTVSGHVYDNDCDTNCNSCGAIRTVDHNFSDDSDIVCDDCEAVRYVSYSTTSGKITITDCNTEFSGDIEIPSSIKGKPVVAIGDYAFYDCKDITSIALPSSIVTIGYKAFDGCTSVETMHVPASVKTISDDAFVNMTSLTTITVSSDNTAYSAVDGVLFNKAKSKLIAYPAAKTNTEYTIPSTVTTIEQNAFLRSTKLTSVVIPNGVTTIGKQAFYYCYNLETLVLPENLISIGDNAFYYCNKLKNIVIPNAVETIGDSAFFYCGAVASVTLPKSIKSIGPNAFKNCHFLTDVYYLGTVHEAGLININVNNAVLNSATWHYDSCIGKIEHTFDDCYDLVCNVCSATRSEVIHAYNNACDTTCNICGLVRSVPGHVYTNSCDVTCNICNAIRLITHIYDNSCDTVCNVCGAERTTVHFYSNKCDVDCNVCGMERTVPDHVYTNSCDSLCNECGFVRTITHTFSGPCDIDCDICGALRRAPHDFDNACDDTCDVCGTEREVADHVYSSDCDIDCNECGVIRTTAEDHIYTNNCDKFCDLCGYMRTVPAHVYNDACDTTCNECGDIRSVPDHVYTNTCDTTCNVCEAVRTIEHTYLTECSCICDVCGYVRVAPVAHTYNDTCDTSCNVCGEIRTIAHTYSNSCDIDCNVCGFTRSVTHTYTNACDKECDVCGNVRKASHVYSSACDEICDLCGKVREVEYEHAYTNERDEECNNCGGIREIQFYIKGDINGDLALNLMDLIILARYNAGWDVEVNTIALDVNGDGMVDLEDTTCLSKYLACWDVEIY